MLIFFYSGLMCYFIHLSAEKHKVWNYTSGVKTLLCLGNRPRHSSNCSAEKAVSKPTMGRGHGICVSTAVQLHDSYGSPIQSLNCSGNSSLGYGRGHWVNLANRDLLISQSAISIFILSQITFSLRERSFTTKPPSLKLNDTCMTKGGNNYLINNAVWGHVTKGGEMLLMVPAQTEIFLRSINVFTFQCPESRLCPGKWTCEEQYRVCLGSFGVQWLIPMNTRQNGWRNGQVNIQLHWIPF